MKILEDNATKATYVGGRKLGLKRGSGASLLKGLQAAKLKAPVKSYVHPNRKVNKQPPGGLQTLDTVSIFG